jgi:S1-C subfamily serine protease
MKKTPLYSSSRVRPVAAAPGAAAPAAEAPDAAGTTAAAQVAPDPAPVASRSTPATRWRPWALRHERRLWLAAMLLVLCALTAALWQLAQPQRPGAPSLKQIDAALRKSLLDKPLPSLTARAFEKVQGSLVKVSTLDEEADDNPHPQIAGVGSGVVIIDNGTILTNLHVVQGAKRIRVTFSDGHESEATLITAQPEHDLAVLRARSIPDDLQAATLRGTSDLKPGDAVVVAGFPFGIGPSVSSGVVSGLERSFNTPTGELMTDLIQFDAAANPGNSGGPLINQEGEVIGIVTAILNPSRQRVFIGIGFAVPIEAAAGAAGMPPF